MRTILAFVLAVAAIPGLQAQSAPSFEVASIKPSKGDGPRGMFGVAPGGRFTAEGMTAADLMTIAYSSGVPIRRFQVTGGPGWIDSEDSPIYVLGTVRAGQLGPKLKASSFKCPEPGSGPPPPSEAEALRQPCIYRIGYGVLTGRGVPMSQLAYSIANFYGIGRLVVDRTGLSGGYDMDMEWAPLTQFRQPGNLDPPPDAAERPVNAGPTIFVSLRDQLGLSLEPSRGPVPTVVIERVEKPTEN